MKPKLLLVGRNKAFCMALERTWPSAEVYVLEEADIHARQQQSPFVCSAIKETRLGAYQQSLGLMDTVRRWHAEVGFDAVMPGVEYAVCGAGAVAQDLGLRFLGSVAVSSLTNKLRLRTLGQKAGILQPRFQKISSIEDVRQFYAGHPIVIKPANRQASAGVIKINTAAEIEQAYQEMLAADEVGKIANRPMTWEFLAEEYVPGSEVSIETIVQNGEAKFHNITGKLTTEGKYFVEVGHVVPAVLDQQSRLALIDGQNQLVRALQAQDGFLHAEWKVNSRGPHLIECAGRPAGDSILELIEQAYGFNVYETILHVLVGESPELPLEAQRGSCIRFFEPPVGRLVEVKGLESLQQAGDVVEWSFTAAPGQELQPLTSSWARVGHVMVNGLNNRAALERAQALIRQVEIVVG